MTACRQVQAQRAADYGGCQPLVVILVWLSSIRRPIGEWLVVDQHGLFPRHIESEYQLGKAVGRFGLTCVVEFFGLQITAVPVSLRGIAIRDLAAFSRHHKVPCHEAADIYENNQ